MELFLRNVFFLLDMKFAFKKYSLKIVFFPILYYN